MLEFPKRAFPIKQISLQLHALQSITGANFGYAGSCLNTRCAVQFIMERCKQTNGNQMKDQRNDSIQVLLIKSMTLLSTGTFI